MSRHGDDAAAHALVISLNIQRRDLTAGQRAIVAARCMEQMPERRGRPEKGAQTGHNKSRDGFAKAFKVGKTAVQQAKTLVTEASDLVADVDPKFRF